MYCPSGIQKAAVLINDIQEEYFMQWTTPAYTDLRFGFEITMYIANR